MRLSLIKIFTWRGYSDAEELADETINRVTQKLGNIVDTYTGDPALYFYGVANLCREQREANPPHHPDHRVGVADRAAAGAGRARLGRRPGTALQVYARLPRATEAEGYELFLLYYGGENKPKNYRKELARHLGMTPNALRVRIKRIRTHLQKCIQACVAQGQA